MVNVHSDIVKYRPSKKKRAKQKISLVQCNGLENTLRWRYLAAASAVVVYEPFLPLQCCQGRKDKFNVKSKKDANCKQGLTRCSSRRN